MLAAPNITDASAESGQRATHQAGGTAGFVLGFSTNTMADMLLSIFIGMMLQLRSMPKSMLPFLAQPLVVLFCVLFYLHSVLSTFRSIYILLAQLLL